MRWEGHARVDEVKFQLYSLNSISAIKMFIVYGCLHAVRVVKLWLLLSFKARKIPRSFLYQNIRLGSMQKLALRIFSCWRFWAGVGMELFFKLGSAVGRTRGKFSQWRFWKKRKSWEIKRIPLIQRLKEISWKQWRYIIFQFHQQLAAK